MNSKEEISFPLTKECSCCDRVVGLFNIRYVWGRDNSAEASYYCRRCRSFSFILRPVPSRELEE